MNRKLKISLFVILDLLSICFAWIISIIFLRYNLRECMQENWPFFISSIVLAIGMNATFGLYSKLWRYAGFGDALRIILSASITGVFSFIVCYISIKLTVEWALITTFLFLSFLGVTRLVYRLFGTIVGANRIKRAKNKSIKVMVIGAGGAGAFLIREMIVSNKIKMCPVCVVDDDKNKLGMHINGVKVAGDTTQIKKLADNYNIDEIIIAIPSASHIEIKRIVMECQKTNCKLKIVPGLYQLMNGQVSISDIKEVSIQDLLGREQVKVNLDEIMGYIEDKVVMVTGGGGSIGSELCRQIASHKPKQLIILDIYENNAYEIQQELLRKHQDLNLLVLIASVRDENKIEKVFKKYKPQIVFHAAAHKHVPLMETSPNEAVKNNVGGTFNVASIAGKNNAEKFILISTDKAVNPTNIMGATKRICEMIIQTMDKKYKTDYVAVRFGNVLGSNGSVIPLFKQQIKEGGPVTVTDKKIVRYFMTIPEAVSLVLQAGAYAHGGEIFVLDMGEPVNIYDLAVNMVKLSGFEPFKDIDIVVTGLRPGEKLYEERLMSEEGLQKTANDKISIGKPLDINEEKLFSNIKSLIKEASNETENMKQLVSELVPTYKIDER